MKEKEVESIRRTEKAMVSAMSGVLLEEMVRAAAVTWYGHILRREKSNILKGALNFKVTGRRKVGRQTPTTKKQVEALIKDIGLRKKAG